MDPSGTLLHSINPYTFPAKLWCLVNTPEITAIIWNRGGDGILIDKALIETQVLSPTTETLRKLSKFRGIKFLSFVRQLHHYGFRKVQPVYSSYPSIHHFYHPGFKKNHPELLQWVRRQVRQHRCQPGADPKPCNQPHNTPELHGGKSVLFSRERRRLILKSVRTHTQAYTHCRSTFQFIKSGDSNHKPQFQTPYPYPDFHVELKNSRSTTVFVVSAGIFHQRPKQPCPVSTRPFSTRAKPLCLPGMPPVAGMSYSMGDDLGFDLMHHPYLNCGIPDLLQFSLPGSDQYNPGCYVSSELDYLIIPDSKRWSRQCHAVLF